MNTGQHRKTLKNLGFCRYLTDLHLKLDSASDYNAVYNYITKKQACQGVFVKKLKFFQKLIQKAKKIGVLKLFDKKSPLKSL